MKFALDYKKLHLRFICGIGFALHFMGKQIKRENPEADFKPLLKSMKKLLKNYKRENGSLNLVEIESKETRILIKL
ncbi:MAG: hypothetical protein K2N23_04085 [Clostridia bacterium]|nr:hypothetical protein [Clostridia bacterium]